MVFVYHNYVRVVKFAEAGAESMENCPLM